MGDKVEHLLAVSDLEYATIIVSVEVTHFLLKPGSSFKNPVEDLGIKHHTIP